MKLFNSTCKFWKECKFYNKESNVCTETAGMYYDYDRPAGCYRNMIEEKLKKLMNNTQLENNKDERRTK